MGTMQPIRDLKDIQRLKEYFLIKHQYRNYALIVMGVNLPLRISDLLSIKWGDVYDDEVHKYTKHILVQEQKTGKTNIMFLNKNVIEALEILRKDVPAGKEHYIFSSHHNYTRPISRVAAYQVIRQASEHLGIKNVGCHSLRKTFGYHAWKNGAHPAVIMQIYNHSSLSVTKRYLGVEQDDVDEVFQMLEL